MALSSALSDLEASMLRFLEAAKIVGERVTHTTSPPVPATSHPEIPPLSVEISPTGEITLTGGALSPSSLASIGAPSTTVGSVVPFQDLSRSLGIQPNDPSGSRPSTALVTLPSSKPLPVVAPPITSEPSITRTTRPLATAPTDGFHAWHSRISKPTGPSRSYVSTVLAPQPHSTLSRAQASFSCSTDPSTSDPSISANPRGGPNPQAASHGDRLRNKISSLQNLAKKGYLVCYRCGDKGHPTRDCCNGLICFACNRLGDRSTNYQATTMLPSSSRPLLPMP